MIQANELRIGNLIERRGEAGVVCSIDREHVWLQFGGEWGDMERWLHESVDPIPLTPDILEKCGFKKMGMFWIRNRDYRCLVWEWGLQNVTYHTQRLGGDFEGLDMPLLSVHQFQNLYFCLTNEELEVKL